MRKRGWTCASAPKKQRSRDHGEGYASAGHHVAVEAHQHRKRHTSRHDPSTPAPKDQSRGGGCRLWRASDGVSRHHKLQRHVYGNIKDGNRADAEHQSDGQATLRIANLAGNGGHEVPTIVGPQRCQEGGHETGESASRVGV